MKFFLLSLLLFSFPFSYGQNNISLNLCTSYIEEVPSGSRPERIAHDGTNWICEFPGAPTPRDIVLPNLYENEVIPCETSPDRACLARQVCDHRLSTIECVAMTQSRAIMDGNLLFTGAENQTPCRVDFAEMSGQDLSNVNVSTVEFEDVASGINEDCRELLRLYQLQEGRLTVPQPNPSLPLPDRFVNLPSIP